MFTEFLPGLPIPHHRLHSMQRAMILVAVLGSALFAGVSAQAQQAAVADPPAGTETTEKAASQATVTPGINDQFVNPELDVNEWTERFEIESREVFSARQFVLKACGLKPGDRVADIGAGTGFYSRLFAEAVGDQGWVYAVDISPRFLEHILVKSREHKIYNLTTVLCSDRSTRLPPESVNAVFICDTYHHFEHHESTLESIFTAMKPGGTLIVIDFDRIPGKSRDFILGHVRAGKEVFQREIETAGFDFVDEVDVPGFEENYLLRFRKPT